VGYRIKEGTPMSIAEHDARKLRGGYYTPKAVATWLTRWAIQSPLDRILEPSCGDGVFLEAALGLVKQRPGRQPQLVGVELEAGEAAKARSRAGNLAHVIRADFFEWLERAGPGTFDVVLGNPPFIRYQHFPEPARTRAMRFLESQGLRPNRLTNIWVPFVVGSMHLLRAGGRLGMVIPAELLQVTYAGQLRQFLADSFRRVTVVTCNEMFFDNAEQEVVILAAEGKLPSPNAKNCCDIALVEAQTVAELLGAPLATERSGKRAKFIQHGTEKWLKYFLSASEIAFMRALREHPAIGTLGEHASVDVGVVTGRNEFFVLSRTEVEQHQLSGFVSPLVARSAHLPGAVLGEEDHRRLAEAGKRVYLLDLAKHPEARFSPGLRSLIREGEQRGYHRGYKCRIRDPWYHVPAVWQPDGFFFRQIYDFPRVVVNRAGATSTDTIHRMRCRGPTEKLVASLYTHLTAASAEIEGRSYGGGVLELEPTEAERLLVPRQRNGAMPIAEADRLVRRNLLREVLESNDRLVLRESLGLSRVECGRLKRIWAKMRDRRRIRCKR
jgi:adenine-specific DNA methylase